MKKKLAAVAVLAAAALWGTMGIFVRHFNAAGLYALDVCLLRMASGLLLMGTYLAIFHREKLKIRLRDIWCFIGTGVCSLFFFSVCYFKTIEMTSMAVAGVLLYTAPIFVMLMSLVLFRENMNGRKALALALAFVGCILVSGLGGQDALSRKGILIGLGSGFGYALYSIFGRYAINRGYESWTVTFYTFLFCTAAAVFAADWGAIEAAFSQNVSLWAWLAGMGLTTACMAYFLYTWGLERIESSRASILASLEPVVAAVLGVAVFRETIPVAGIVGIILVLGAIVVLSVKGKSVNKL